MQYSTLKGQLAPGLQLLGTARRWVDEVSGVEDVFLGCWAGGGSLRPGPGITLGSQERKILEVLAPNF